MPGPYEINIDPDMAHGDALTIFINYRVIDTNGIFLGAAGVGISVNSMNAIVENLQAEHDTAAFFVDREGRILVGAPYGITGSAASDGATLHSLADDQALGAVAAEAIGSGGGSFRYKRDGKARLLLVRPVPELKWFLFVEHTEDVAISDAGRALLFNLVVFFLLVGSIITLTAITVDRFQSRLERTASYDQLTGALNRMSFSVLSDHAIKESRRTGDPLSIAMFDIDGFKRVNDERGHYAGDNALKLVVAGGRSGLRQSDSLCRWGGEEFIALLTSCDTPGALAAAEKFRSSASTLCKSEGSGTISLSAGVATLRPDEDFHSLVNRADEALLSAKRAGKDRTVSAEG
jgi:diguanylate cyclase (GGDEF)-like protein